MSANKFTDHPYGCSVEATLSVIGGRWKPVIIFKLMENGTMRFGELEHIIGDISQRVLTNQLRELKRDKIINRVAHPEVPPRVEYSLTDYGRTLEPIMLAMRDWGAEHMGVTCEE
ncbi:MAG: helix-turn-helix domain-containing protein [Pseudomonadota bacterium]